MQCREPEDDATLSKILTGLVSIVHEYDLITLDKRECDPGLWLHSLFLLKEEHSRIYMLFIDDCIR